MRLKKFALRLLFTLTVLVPFQANAQETTTTSATTGVNSCNDTNSCLMAIMQNTYYTLQNVNNLPNYLNQLGQLAVSWLANDDSDSTTQMQSNFASMGSLIGQSIASQFTNPVQLTADLYGQPQSAFTTPPDQPSILNMVPNINDITYSTMVGQPPVAKAAATPYNYVKTASGFNISHTTPILTWQGRPQDRQNYTAFFNTVMAVESFNAYVMNNQYGNAATYNNNQIALINQASSSDWLAQVATEELGKVLRQILMFESQNYILNTQMIQLQRQLITAQIMTNTLLILSNKTAEGTLLAKAQGVRQTG